MITIESTGDTDHFTAEKITYETPDRTSHYEDR
jgi:hypothetical protein